MGGEWEARVEEEIWRGVKSTTDLSKNVYENLLLQKLPTIDTYIKYA